MTAEVGRHHVTMRGVWPERMHAGYAGVRVQVQLEQPQRARMSVLPPTATQTAHDVLHAFLRHRGLLPLSLSGGSPDERADTAAPPRLSPSLPQAAEEEFTRKVEVRAFEVLDGCLRSSDHGMTHVCSVTCKSGASLLFVVLR